MPVAGSSGFVGADVLVVLHYLGEFASCTVTFIGAVDWWLAGSER